MNPFGMQPGIILLREGTDTSQGKPQLISNINACSAIADSIRTTLGPSGRDKLIGTSNGKVTISNDGATIMKLLEIEHPAAKTLVDISMSQDIEVGDGTTSVVLLASEILSCLKSFVEENVHPQIIMQCIQKASQLAVDQISQLSINFEDDSDANAESSKYKEMLLKCASTALNSKLISTHKDLFAPMVVDAVLELSKQNGLDDIKEAIAIKKIPGGDVRQSFRVPSGGVAFKKTFSYAGFEQMTKQFDHPKILLLNVELELKSEKENAEVRIEAGGETSINETYQSIVDAEWDIIYTKLNNCINIGSNIVLSRLPIGDLATQYFADHGLFCAGRVTDDDMYRIAKATGAVIQTTTNNMSDSDKILGTCGKFEEKQVGDERFNIFTDCPNTLTSTIILRGGTEQFIAESERSIHDAIMVVKRCIQSTNHGIVPGGGAIEMELSKFLRHYSLTIKGKQQLIVKAFAKALEVIPRQLSDNAGYDATDILSALRKKHQLTDNEDGKYYGVDVDTGSICNTYTKGVWEPCDNKMNSIQAATEAACVILSIDETVIAPRSQDPAAQQATGQMGGGGGAMPMSSMMGGAMNAAANAQGGTKGSLGPGVSYMKGRN